MKIVLDTHTHTIASGHGYNTIYEMAHSAKQKNLELLCITEHGMALPGTCHEYYFHNLRVVRRNQDGVELLMGAEINIIDYEGNLDMDEYVLDCLDIGIASMHIPCIKPGTKEQNTNAILGAMKNKKVSIIGHSDDGRYPLDYECIVKAAKENRVAMEINNSSLNPNGFRKDARDNDIEILQLCKKYNSPITLGSDAHVADDIANYCYARELLELTQFPEELILNTSVQKFKSYLGL
jgi:Histidinol phosphatase and related hydrolases of the PHP family